MQRLFAGRSPLGLLAGIAVLVLPSPDVAAKEGEDVKFDTVDKVELRGTFYTGNKNKPTVLLVHKLGGKRDQDGWRKLAEALSDKGYAVLRFDFRGHGDSTTVAPAFWMNPVNRQLIRGARAARVTIAYRDFMPSYKPWLVNDLAAAKRYLDEQNNAGACNSSDLIVVGAEDGAALAALWIASEWLRRPVEKNAFGTWVAKPDAKPEGSDIAAGIWLSAPRSWGGVPVGSKWLSIPADERKPLFVKSPMLFLYGRKDVKGAASAKDLLASLKRKGAEARLTTFPKLTNTKGVNGNGVGADLLGKKAVGADDFIKEYIGSVMDGRANTVWRKRSETDAPEIAVDRRVLNNLGIRLP
ncbi:MAG TPA: alpha/beta fold hydrolase [Gemmataceae bacterium]|jgi:pimeloyl-ACP methyl ester carboxylesterase|nr:alpha/beta fold hydrolase [Gemmataceae bacterium]